MPIKSAVKQSPIDAEPAAAGQSARLSTSKALDGKRILLLEDQGDMSSYIKNFCERHGATVTVAENGRSGLDQFENHQFDLLISDINMPEIDGYHFIQSVRTMEAARGGPMLPAIALTAYASSSDRVKALQAGFQSHVPKPVNQDELLTVARSLLGSKP